MSFVPELDQYVITCTAYGPPGPCVYLATSPDLYSLNSGHVVIPPEDKNAALFPRRIDGSWLLLHRPVVMASNSADIWVSRSEDLISWRDPQPVLLRRSGGWWDAARVGIAPPPIETSEGWLQIYHGVRNTVSGAIYRVGAALLDLDEPWVVRRRTDRWLLSPSDPWERIGDVGNVVFPCGSDLSRRRPDRPLLRRRRHRRLHGDGAALGPARPAAEWRRDMNEETAGARSHAAHAQRLGRTARAAAVHLRTIGTRARAAGPQPDRRRPRSGGVARAAPQVGADPDRLRPAWGSSRCRVAAAPTASRRTRVRRRQIAREGDPQQVAGHAARRIVRGAIPADSSGRS